MGFLDKLFHKNSKEEEKLEEEVSEFLNPPEESIEDAELCSSCGLPMIKSIHDTRILQGKRFHRKCAKKMMKKARKMHLG